MDIIWHNILFSDNQVDTQSYFDNSHSLAEPRPERIYNPIATMGFSAMFTFQLDNTKR